ncbi:MAG: PAS domain-containing protein, partial [Candidatus Hydrogenedentes bacterium]|nr:PAS domain-containing protein [Candidatus Hydrogenedentota bacterium]
MSNLQAAESGSTTYSTLAQRQMFEQLRCAEGVFDAIGDGLLAVTHEGRVLFCNQMARTLLGEDLPSIEPRQWREKYRFKTPEMSAPPDQRVPLLLALRGEEVTRQEMHLSGDGVRNVWLSLTARPVRDHEGRFSWAYIVLRDINLRKWSEEAMRLRDRAIAAVLEGIAITDARDPHKPIIHVNEGFERLTGYSRDEVLGRDCTFLYGTAQDDDEVREARSELRKDQAVTLELRNHRKDGSLYWCRLSITPVHDRAGVVTHFIAVVSDITELIETERKLQETTRELQAANRKIMWANKRMRRNLAAAARVQQGLLPTALPEIPGVSFAWAFEPAEELSGDFLNVIPLDDEHVALYVLDVTGHGVASAMVSVTVSRLLSPVHSATSLVYEQDPESGAYTVATAGKVATR